MSDYLQKLIDDPYNDLQKRIFQAVVVMACLFDFVVVGPATAYLLTIGGISSGWTATIANLFVPLMFVGMQVVITSQVAYYGPMPGMAPRSRRHFVSFYMLGVLLAMIAAGTVMYSYGMAFHAVENPQTGDYLAVILPSAVAFILHYEIVSGWKMQRQLFNEFRLKRRLKKLESIGAIRFDSTGMWHYTDKKAQKVKL